MRSIFIIFLMMQWTRSGYGVEHIPDRMVNENIEMIVDDSDESSLQELTTMLNYESRTETNPPILTSSASTLEALTSSENPLLFKLIGPESTEPPSVELFTEVPLASVDSMNDEQPDFSIRKATLKPKGGRLLEPKDLFDIKDKDNETLEAFSEDTTTIVDIDAEMNETNIDTLEEATTVQPITSKKSKQFEFYKTRPNEFLRHYVEDSHLRSPVAALIDKKANPLSKAKKLWKAALKPNALLDIMVVSYDSEGKFEFEVVDCTTNNCFFTGIKSTYNLTNTRAMISTLDRVREENTTNQESKTYYSIIRTGQLIPYDSAIFLSTDELPNDTEHQNNASMILLKKRIRVSCRT